MTTPFMADKQREAFTAQMAIVSKAEAALRELPLPDFWEHPTCCYRQTLQVVEPGYVRCDNVDEVVTGDEGVVAGVSVDGPYMHASTDGWDSMSETGTVEYLECTPHNGGCGAIWAVPKELEWD